MKKTFLTILSILVISCNSEKKIVDENFTFSTWTHGGKEFNKEIWEKKINYLKKIWR